VDIEMSLDAMGVELNPENVLAATRMGIFPWYDEPGQPMWYSPEQRCIFWVNQFKPSKSLQQAYRKHKWEITIDEAFRSVMENCAGNGRENSTWILPEMIEAYCSIHEMGYAHSVEVWNRGKLVGGLYGIALGSIFCGESMFSLEPNTSKFALWQLIEHVKKMNFHCIDAQVANPHLLSMGACMISKDQYMRILKDALSAPDRLGKDFAVY
jgi:leucyl/phenylalanyl-tRNA--protein transferase